jgi:hypothetical protein
MFGIEDPGVWLAYLLCIFSTLFCFVYGILNWNKGDEQTHPEDVKWAKDEKAVQETL